MNKQVVEIVTQRLQESLNAGVIPWQKTWDTFPRNLKGRNYTGLNTLLLGMSSIQNSFSSSIWGTYNQVSSMGGTIKTEELKKYTTVIFWKVLEKEESGKKSKIFMLRYYRVYNFDQMLNIKDSQIPAILDTEKFADSTSLISTYLSRNSLKYQEGGNSASYNPSSDKITMPLNSSFMEVDPVRWQENKSQVTFHEIAHSTGHQSRLNRKEVVERIIFGSSDYSHEELVAEISSCFLCNLTKIDPNYINSASYLNNWKKALQDNSDWFITASSKAQKAVDFVLGNSSMAEEEDDSD